MPDYTKEDMCWVQNLIDAGLDEILIQVCSQLKEQGNTKELLKILGKHRSQLLKNLHIVTDQMDSLDYLIAQFKKEH
ncbi:MAG: hypothetical protein KBT48_06580 [Firmicutes bacterium]|nr:hypothetical protein [Bacillota bacterium]